MQNLVELFARVWNGTFAGISVGQLVVAVVVLLVFLLLRRFFARFIITRLKALTSKTKTDIDDHILAALQQPLMFLFLILGLSFVIQWFPFEPSIEKVLVQILQSFVAFTIFWTIFSILDPVSIFFDTFLKKIAGAVAHEVKDYLLKALKVFVVGSGIVAVLAQWGIDPWPYFAGIGVLSLPFAFAAKDAVSNVFGGIKLLIVDQTFRVGDWIESPSIGHGIVEVVTLSTVKVRKFSKAVQTIPNGVIAAEPITNWSRMTNRRIKMDIGLTYGTTSDQFKNILGDIRDLIASDHRIDHEVTQMVHLVGFKQSSIDINLYYFTKTTDWEEWRSTVEDHILS
ncbi:MAG TPA: mechanosensitive ion channel family protein, partial [Rhodospirillales bacterium]|nr:mechanosensitive ion channel family protein [Rhodospirillales bacterium]